jgi:hypothetical protein
MIIRLLDNGKCSVDTFAKELHKARIKFGAGFRDKPDSRLEQIHLNHGRLYGLFNRSNHMIAGLAAHNLEMMPQTLHEPDLTHYTPNKVWEISELWTSSLGAGSELRIGMMILGWEMSIEAILIYLALEPFNNTKFYRKIGFKQMSSPIRYPFLETINGLPFQAAPFLLSGDEFDAIHNKYINKVDKSKADLSAIEFRSFIR